MEENITSNSTTPAMGSPQNANDVDIYYLPNYLAAYWLDTVSLWILLIIGLVGNSLSIVTILRMPPLNSSSLYVVFLAVTDSCALIIKLALQQVTKNDIGIGNAGCRAILFLGNSCVMTANWLVVAMTAERLIAVWFPLKVSAISTKNKACVVFLSLVLVLMGINVCYLFMYVEYYDDIFKYFCGYLNEYSDFIKNVYYWMDAAFFAVIPCFLVLILNTLILVGTWRSMRKQQTLTENQEQIAEKQKQQNQITAMLVTVSVIFFILTIPNGIYYMTYSLWDNKNNYDKAEQNLVERVALFLSDCNHAVNFFLYFLSGRRFRNMFMKMICRRCNRKSRQANSYEANGSSVSGTRFTGISSDMKI